MEGTGHWVTDSLPTFAQNLHILLVDHDPVSLKHLASLLQQQSYIVTTTEQASSAISMIMEKGVWFDLVMANASMPDMDSFSFLNLLLKKNIAVILMSSGMHLDIAVKALAKGACFLLEKPVVRDDLKYLWQHAYRRNEDVNKPTHYNNDIDCHPTMDKIKETNKQIASHNSHVESNFGGKRSIDEIEDLNRQKKVKFNLKPVEFGNKRIDVDDCEKRREYYITGERRSRIVWNEERRRKFTDAFNKLGDKTRPKLIMKMMNEPCLTLRQVANHLQKYKAQVECDEKKRRNMLPSRQESRSNFSVKSTTQLVEKKRPERRNRHGKKGLISSVGRDKFQLIAPRTLPNPQLPVSDFVNHGLRMLNNSFENVGLNYNPVSHNIEDFRIQGSTFQNDSWKKFVIGEGVQAFESRNLPNVSKTTPAFEPRNLPNVSETTPAFESRNLPNVSETTPAFESRNLPNVSKTTPENTYSDILDDIQFPDNLFDVIQQLDLNDFGIENQEAMEYSGNTEEMQSMFGEIDLPNLDNVFADFIDESNQFGNIVGQEILPSGSEFQQLPQYVDILNVLEDDPYYSGTDISLSEVDKYSEWLRNAVIEQKWSRDGSI